MREKQQTHNQRMDVRRFIGYASAFVITFIAAIVFLGIAFHLTVMTKGQMDTKINLGVNA